jgi:hypothetical protein
VRTGRFREGEVEFACIGVRGIDDDGNRERKQECSEVESEYCHSRSLRQTRCCETIDLGRSHGQAYALIAAPFDDDAERQVNRRMLVSGVQVRSDW